jgi:transcriptional regulator
MYISKLNIQTNADAIKNYIKENAFATIITSIDNEIYTTHTPLILKSNDSEDYLHGHIAKANLQAKFFENYQRVTAVFMEKHTYISSSWYDHINVPTWNYIAVHIHGEIQLLGEKETLESLHELVDKYESHSDKPFHISQMTDRDLKAHLNGLVAFKILIKKIDASWKLSQNRDNKNYLEIIKKLRERGDDMSLYIAKEMENNREI